MRKVTFGGASSLDNYFARADGSVDWLMWSDEAAEIMKEFWPKIDAMVMGRKTWEIARQYEAASKKKKKTPVAMPTYVFSRTLEPGERDGVVFTNEDPGEFVRRLKQQPGKDICIMGGGDLAKTLFEAGVIDEIGFNIQPVLLGSGIPLFHEMERQINLQLIECRPFRNGCVYVSYRVIGSS